MISIALVLMLSSQAVAQPDGTQAPIGKLDSEFLDDWYDVPFWKGTITHDMVSPVTNPFLGQYDGSAYDLSSRYGVQDYEYDTLYENEGANITANPAEINYQTWNHSGLIRKPVTTDLDDGEWDETDSGSLLTTSIVKTGGKQYASDALHLVYSGTDSSASANLLVNFPSAIPTTKYFVFGAYINSESMNVTASATIYLYEERDGSSSGDYVAIALGEGYTDWSTTTSSGTHLFKFDDDASDVIFFVYKLSDWDDKTTNVDLSGISSARIGLKYDANVNTGAINMDIFAFEFLDSIPRFGRDEGDITSDSDDYVSFNTTDPSSADKVVLSSELSTKVTSIEDAQIDFVAPLETTTVNTYDDLNRIQYIYDAHIDQEASTENIINNAVTWGSLSMNMLMFGGEDDYLQVDWAGNEKKSNFLNEEQGDFIQLATSLAVDTQYHLEVLIQYSSADYAFILGNNSSDNTNFIMGIFVSAIVFIGALISKLSPKAGGTVSKQANRLRSKKVNKQGFKPARRSR